MVTIPALLLSYGGSFGKCFQLSRTQFPLLEIYDHKTYFSLFYRGTEEIQLNKMNMFEN